MLASTKQFVQALEQKEIRYTDQGTTEGGKDMIAVTYGGDNMSSIRVQFFFDENGESVALRVFDIVKVSDDKVARILTAVNEQNARFRFVKFVLDVRDNTVQAEIDASFRNHDVGDVCLEALQRMVGICDDAYPELMKAMWA